MADAAEGKPVPGRPDVTWVGSPARLAAIQDALDRFDRAGLDLPRLHVEFADTREPCGGQNGRFLSGHETDPDAVRHIVVCRRLPVILLHELAHAWERTATSDETRAELLDFWGLERWNDIEDDWSDRGAEMAAESIAYALTIDGPTTNPVMVRYACGFGILTGSPLFPVAPNRARMTTSDDCPPDPLLTAREHGANFGPRHPNPRTEMQQMKGSNA